MSVPLLPLFPLSLVLLPGMYLPLHIFEERYKEMIGDVLDRNAEFGVVQARGEGIVNVGCSAGVYKVVERHDDGRLDLVALGRRRFLIGSVDQTRSFLQAEVEFFDDEEEGEAPADLGARARATLETLTATGRDPALLSSGALLSFQIAAFLDDPDKRQTVLAIRSEAERLRFLVRAVPEYLARQQQIELARRVGPLNGHAKHVVSS